MEILYVERPLTQRRWALDGVSKLPILRGEPAPFRCIGHNFNDEDGIGKGFRCGKWKLVQYHRPLQNHTDQSCWGQDCQGKNLLYDLSTDLGERHDLSDTEPTVLAAMMANASVWFASVTRSIGKAESDCPARVVPPGIIP